jgi:hypothetical protein
MIQWDVLSVGRIVSGTYCPFRGERVNQGGCGGIKFPIYTQRTNNPNTSAPNRLSHLPP